MSQALPYREPKPVAAGMLALAVHVVFLLLLVYGVRWQNRAPDSFAVELWQSLPAEEVVITKEPAPVLAREPEAPPAAPPPVTPKAEIDLREKKIEKKVEKKVEKQTPPEADKKALQRQREAEERRLLQDDAERRRLAAQSLASLQARVRDEVSAATAAEIGRYQDMIRRRIRDNIVMPPDVAPNAEAVFKVTLLPDGTVRDVELQQSSGHRAYDEATERAIKMAYRLPLPTDPLLREKFRVLNLIIRPEEN